MGLSCIDHNPYMYMSYSCLLGIGNYTLLYVYVWETGKYCLGVWEVFWVTLGSIDIDTKYLRVPCLITILTPLNGSTGSVHRAPSDDRRRFCVTTHLGILQLCIHMLRSIVRDAGCWEVLFEGLGSIFHYAYLEKYSKYLRQHHVCAGLRIK